jgi:membrane protein implicated in regulation of membrane protease activity
MKHLLERRTPELITLVLILAGIAGVAGIAYGQAAVAVSAGSSAAPAVDWVLPALEKAGTVGVCLWIIWYFQKRTDANQAKLTEIAERSLVLQERTNETIRDFAHAIRSMRCFAHNPGDVRDSLGDRLR